MKITRVLGSSKTCQEYVEKNLERIGQPKKIVCYQECANFMLGSYDLLESQPHLVLENTNGDSWYFESLNCGYGGAGPCATQAVLQRFGVSEQLSQELSRSPGFNINFHDDETFYHTTAPCLFGYAHEPHFCCSISDYCIVHTAVRQVYFVNPQSKDPAGFFNCLLWMKPYAMNFYLGKKSLSDISLRVISPYDALESKENVKNCNLVVHGHLFTLYCFIRANDLATLVQAISVFLNQKPLFLETFWKKVLLLRPVKKTEDTQFSFKRFLSFFASEPYYEIPLSDFQGEDIREKGRSI